MQQGSTVYPLKAILSYPDHFKNLFLRVWLIKFHKSNQNSKNLSIYLPPVALASRNDPCKPALWATVHFTSNDKSKTVTK